MPLSYVVDEHLRGGGLWQAIGQHNARGIYPLDAVRVGDPPDLPSGSTDPVILLWAEREGRILVTRDENTIPGHLASHLQAGRHSPGVFMLRPRCTIRQVLDALVLIASAGDPAYYRDRIEHIP
jgi:hypothetical protein